MIFRTFRRFNQANAAIVRSDERRGLRSRHSEINHPVRADGHTLVGRFPTRVRLIHELQLARTEEFPDGGHDGLCIDQIIAALPSFPWYADIFP